MLTIPDRIAETAEHFARHSAHGYSQPNRGAGGTEYITLSDGSVYGISSADVDCSEMVRQCVNVGLGYRAITYMWTGNETEEMCRVGFRKLDFLGTLRRGDVLLRSGHTAVYVGDGNISEAAYDERGGITGSTPGDQTGQEVRIARCGTNWNWILRWEDAMTEQDFQRIQKMIDDAVEKTPRKVWSYKNKKLETVDAYQILRDCRDMLLGLIGPTK